MKRFIGLLFLFFSLACFSQSITVSDIYCKPNTIPVNKTNKLYANSLKLMWGTFRLDTIRAADTTVYITWNDTLYNGKIQTKDQHFQINVASNGENNWTIPFKLRPSTVIIYNTWPLDTLHWTGRNSTTLTVTSLSVGEFDRITIIN